MIFFRVRFCIAAAFFFLTVTLWPQSVQPLAAARDPASYIGLTLTEIIGRCGIPKSVYPVRGPELWQDDVVFMYDIADFYVLNDRVWQVGLKEAYLVKIGDPAAAVYLGLGQPFFNNSEYAVFQLAGQNWPMALRFNFNAAGKVAMIFIYRSDL